MGRGLGDDATTAATCGTNPCGILDWLWVSDACCHYLQCASPGDPRISNLDQNCSPYPLLPQVGTEIGATVGNAAGAAVGSTAQGIANTTSGLTTPVLIGVGLLGLFLVLGAMKR